jgi:hypothetical protein
MLKESTSRVNRISVPHFHTSNSNDALVIAIKPEAKTFSHCRHIALLHS